MYLLGRVAMQEPRFKLTPRFCHSGSVYAVHASLLSCHTHHAYPPYLVLQDAYMRITWHCLTGGRPYTAAEECHEAILSGDDMERYIVPVTFEADGSLKVHGC